MSADTILTSGKAEISAVTTARAGTDIGFAVAVMVAGVIYILLIPVLTGGHVSHDVSWYLQAARTWLDGAVLYRDIMDVNPPMVFYLAAPAAAFAELSGVPAPTVFYGMVCGLLVGSLIWGGAILRRYGVPWSQTRFLMAVLFITFGVLPIYELGQREHFLVIMTLPYLLHVLYGPDVDIRHPVSPRLERIFAGIFAGVGFALKPHFLVVPALLMLARCARQRSLRPIFTAEALALGAFVAAYGLVVVIYYPDYLGTVVPLASATYGDYGSSLAAYLQPAAVVIFIGTALVAMRAGSGANRADQAVFYSAIASAGFLVAFLAQGKGWIYHAMPFAAWLGVVFVLRGFFEERAAVSWRGRAIALFIAMFLWMPMFHFSPHQTLKARSDALVVALGPDAAGRRIVSWGSKLNAHFPAVTRINGRWSSRFQCLWPLPGALALVASSDPAEAVRGTNVLAAIRTLAVDDFIKNQPEIVLVPRSTDVPKLFAADPRFGPRWASYRKVSEVHTLEIWVRETLAGTSIGRGPSVQQSGA